MSKLGLHTEVLTPQVIGLIQRARPAIVVTLDLSRERLQQIRPYVEILIGRYDPNGNSQNQYIGNGAALGHFIAQGIAPVADLLTATVVLNEPETWTEAEDRGASKVAATAARVALTLVDACTVLSAAGIKTVVGNFSTGTPRLPSDDGGLVLDALLPGIAAGDYYGGHEYSYPSMRAGYGYLLGRTVKVLDYYAGKGVRKPALLTEYGIDFARVAPQPSGYAANGVTDDAYLADLRWAHSALSVEPRIEGAAVFEVGSYERFASFDLLNTGLGQRYAAFLATTADIPAISPQDAPQGTKGVPVASLPIPLDDQLTSDGPNRWNECGPASIRMVCDYLGIDTGESIDAIDTDETGDESLIGYTTTQQMVDWFAARGVPAVQSQPLDIAAAIAANLARGWPCVFLGYWDRAALTGGHFEVPVADDGAAITFNNPYGAFTEALSYADVNRYSLGWLVTVQQVKPKEQTMATDPLAVAAKARWEALGVGANPATAIFRAYTRMVDVWLQHGQDAVLDPTPAIKPEAVTPDGSEAFLLLDSGRVLHWRKDTGLCYQAEWKEHAAIFAKCGWS